MQMPARRRHSCRKSQQGAALVVVTIIGIGAAALLVSALGKANSQAARDRITASALAQAKEALIGYAAGVILTAAGASRPGDLPCPDTNDDGVAETSCGNASGSTGQASRLGRLPWKSLGLPDLRDGSGERLWYAVSNNFKKSTRTAKLNSDTFGTITVRDASGAIVNDGTNSTGAIAVVIAPGAPITRLDGLAQTRTSGDSTATNYLDIGNGEDNAAFVDGSANGFIQGPVQVSGVTVLNDRLIAITSDSLMPVLEKRVAGEVRQCLAAFANKAANQGRYPWAAPLNPAAPPSYADTSGSRFGRLPDTPFSRTKADSGNVMDDDLTAECKINSLSGWWLNWKEIVFYALADAYKPATPMTAPGCGACLAVNPPSAMADKQVAVFVAGRQLAGVSGGQPRASNADKGAIANYLEIENSTPADDTFCRHAVTPTFNDATAFLP